MRPVSRVSIFAFIARHDCIPKEATKKKVDKAVDEANGRILFARYFFADPFSREEASSPSVRQGKVVTTLSGQTYGNAEVHTQTS